MCAGSVSLVSIVSKVSKGHALHPLGAKDTKDTLFRSQSRFVIEFPHKRGCRQIWRQWGADSPPQRAGEYFSAFPHVWGK